MGITLPPVASAHGAPLLSSPLRSCSSQPAVGVPVGADAGALPVVAAVATAAPPEREALPIATMLKV
jgi:hypothetical protein